MRCLLIPLLLWSTASLGGLAGVEVADADSEAAKGLVAMRDADGDPHRGVDAAIAFSHALTIYKQLGAMDQVSEMQANIFWCKKRMNLDDLQDYVAKKGAAASSDFIVAKQVMETQVPLSEADAYLAHAQHYQSENPDKHFQIAIRFSEIIERFPDTPAAHASEAVFAKEQSAYLAQVSGERAQEKQQLQDAIDHVAATRFMLAPEAVAGTTAVPAEADRARALTAIHTAYHDGYQSRTAAGKRALAQRLFKESEANKDDAAYFYVMLEESTHLALESGEWETVLDAIEQQGRFFVGFDVAAHKQEVLSHARSEPVAVAILTLLKDPKDKRANEVAGKAFCLNLDRWDLGLPMLANGTDGDLRRAAQMELGSPRTPAQQRAIGDIWYELGHRGNSADRIAVWQRANYWYQLALPGMGKINQDELTRRLDEIQDVIPQVDLDWDNVTEKQWNRLKGQEIEIESKVDRSNGDIEVSDDHKVRIVPFPTDKDKMLFQVGTNGARQRPGLLTGSGHLWVFPTTPRRGALDSMTLRFKIVDVPSTP
jgi:hypothetical protein